MIAHHPKPRSSFNGGERTRIDKEEVRSRLEAETFYRSEIQGFEPAGKDEIKALCPFHDDTDPSFHVNTKTGKFYCHGCQAKGDVFSFYMRSHNVPFQKALEALAERAGVRGSNGRKQREHARAVMENCTDRYDYLDEQGKYRFSVLRFEEPGKDKTFRQRHYDFQTESWIQNVKDVALIPYRLNEVVQAKTIYIVEGEKDAENLAAQGFAATCNPQGAGKWRDEFSQYFKGKHIIILPDNDDPGRKHAEQVRQCLLPHAAGIRLVELPGLPHKGDVSDWLAAGGTADKLQQIVTQVEEEMPPAPPFSFATLDLNELRAGRYIETKPEKVRWTLANSLPQGTLGFLVSNGGVGKSWFLLQTAMSVATHLDCLDGIFEIGERGRVFCLFGEDVETVIHTRTQAIFNSFMTAPREGVYYDSATREMFIAELQDHLFLLPGAGRDLRLIRQKDGNPVPTQTYLDLLERLKSIEDLKLVILDPVSRFFVGNENDNVHATYFCSLLERIASETGATVIASHHTNKAATNPNESSYSALVQGAIRGATSFTNASRWQMNLTTLNPKEVREAGGNSVQHFNYIAGKVVKKNLGKPETRFWMERAEGGVLRHFASKLDEIGTDDAVKEKIIDFITDMESEGLRITKPQFSRKYAKEFGLSVRKMGTTIEELLAENRLRIDQSKNEKGRLYGYLTTEVIQK